MAEAVVLGEDVPFGLNHPPRVSLTASGRVRLRVVRRSYSSGEKPVVDVAPDRLVVLKPTIWATPVLPPSPLPTQDEEAREKIEKSLEYHTECMRATVAPDYWILEKAEPGDPNGVALAEYLAYHARQLAAERKKLRDLDGS